MTGRERVLTALSGQEPDRTPFAWGFGPTEPLVRQLESWFKNRGMDWHEVYFHAADTLVLSPTYIGPELVKGQPPYTAVWGIETLDVSYGEGSYQEFVGHPLAGLEDPRQLDDIRWPDPGWFDYADMARRLREVDPLRSKATHLSVTSSGNPLEIYTWMTGMEETMINLVVNPELVCAALDRICDYFQQKLERCAKALDGQIDLIHTADDLGGQTGLLFSRDLYRKIVQPFHKRLIDHARNILPQVKVLYHSDGAVFDILPDLIDAGVDVLEAVQTEAEGMDPQRLKDAYGDRLGFHGAISVQALLPRADAPTVRAECRRLARILGKGGRYIAAPSHAIQAGTPPENIWAMLEGVLGDDLKKLLESK